MAKYDYRGVIHCHSDYSDGTGTMEEIMQAANDSGLDFVMMTDHDTMKPMQDGLEKWHESSLLICGTEITPPNNHFIAFGDKPLEEVEKFRLMEPQKFIHELKERNWFGFIAHPDHVGTKRFEIPSYAWQDWTVKDYTGMGVWDLQTDWQMQLDKDNLSMEVYTEFEKWLTGPRQDTIARWDKLCQERKVVAVGEIDNHNLKREWEGQPLYIFPYETAFRTIMNHVLLDEPLARDYAAARKQIMDAIRGGHFYISFDFWDDPTDFSFEIDNGDTTAGMGEELTLGEGPAELAAMFPEEALINIFLNGESIHEVTADEVLLEIDSPGVYRLEAMRNDLTWILSNPIWVK